MHCWSSDYQDAVAEKVWDLRAKHHLLASHPIREPLGRVCDHCDQPEMRATFFGEPMTAAEARGEFDVTTATKDDRHDPKSTAGRAILTAVDGVSIKCGYCGWEVQPRAIEIARWLQ
jgi:hypothetical protein